MGIRKTESRIPAGMAPSGLGYASESVEISGRKCTIISLLSDELVRYRSGRISDNQYLIFIENSSPELDHVEYKWIIEGMIQGQDDWVEAYRDESFKPEGMLNFNLDLRRQISCLDSMLKLRVGVELRGFGSQRIRIPPLEHRIVEFSAEFQGREESQESTMSYIGEKSVSNEINNQYLDYIDAVRNSEPELATPGNDNLRKINLILAIVYGSFMESLNKRDDRIEKWEKLLNEDQNDNQLRELPIGVSGINPVLFSMFVSEPERLFSETGDFSKVIKREQTPEAESYLNHVFAEHFPEVTENQKIDLFNILRFPRSNLCALSWLLDRLKKRRPETSNLTWNQLIANRDQLAILLDEFWNGPTDQEISKLHHQTKAIDLINTSYVMQMSNLTICEKLRGIYYTRIETDVLDPIGREAEATWTSLNQCVITRNFYAMRYEFPFLTEIFHEVYREVLNLDFTKFESEGESTNSGDEEKPPELYSLIIDTQRWTIGDVEEIPPQGIATPEILDMTAEETKSYRKRLSKNSVLRDYAIKYKVGNITIPRDTEEIIKLFRSHLIRIYQSEMASSCFGNRESSPDRYLIEVIERINYFLERNQQRKIASEFSQEKIHEQLQISRDQIEEGLKEDTLNFYESSSISNTQVRRIIIRQVFSEYIYELMEPMRLTYKSGQPVNIDQSIDTALEQGSDLEEMIAALRTWAGKSRLKVRMIVCGYADLSFNSNGDRETYNRRLSQRRIDWFLKQFNPEEEENIVDEAETYACGDKYSTLPRVNPEFREVRVIFKMAFDAD